MLESELDLLAIKHGSVTAPAGCGKTHLIAAALARHKQAKPILVLTHTNAGVAALRERLSRAGVLSKAYCLATIDGWAMRLLSLFPARSGIPSDTLALRNPGVDYPAIRHAATLLLKNGHINDIIAVSYTRLIVDEYQDCSILQHVLIAYAAQILPTCVLGDPMQAIFGFGSDNLARWQEDICKYFPPVGKLTIPWRWINANAEPLGYWLLEIREKLFHNEPINLSSAPSAVNWIELDGSQDHQRQLLAARIKPPGGNHESVLIIGDSKNPARRHQFASQTPGAITVEAVDLKDLVSFAQTFSLGALDSLEKLAQFAQSVMSNVGATDLIRRVQSLTRGTARNPATSVEQAALIYIQAPSFHTAINLLVEIGKDGGVRTHRPAILRACIKALQLCDAQKGLALHDAAIQIREQNRILGRPLPKRAVGSTLLLKGLEAEVAVILDADAMNAKNLYVAMTRGSKILTVCSRNRILNPCSERAS